MTFKDLMHLLFGLANICRSKPLLIFLRKTQLIRIKQIEHLFNPNISRRYSKIRHSISTLDAKGKFGDVLTVDINDVIGYKFWIRGVRDPQIVKICEKFCSFKGAVFLDVGANIGTTSVASAIKSNCKVICIEASKHNISLLSRNLFSNSINSQVFHCAVTAPEKEISSKEIDLFVSPGNTGSSSLMPNWNTSQVTSITEKAPTSTIDKCLEFSKENISNIGLAKIDIEGGEYDALLGASHILGKIPLIVEYINNSSSSKDLAELLSSKYELFFLDEECRTNRFDPTRSCGTMLCMPRK